MTAPVTFARTRKQCDVGHRLSGHVCLICTATKARVQFAKRLVRRTMKPPPGPPDDVMWTRTTCIETTTDDRGVTHTHRVPPRDETRAVPHWMAGVEAD